MKKSRFPTLISAPMLLIGLLSPAELVRAAPPAQTGNFDCAAVDEIPQAECEALAAFYRGTNGDSWRNHKGWLAKATPCHWDGIICDQGHVTELRLNTNKLEGSTPPELGQLTWLKYLEVRDNHLSSSIPPELGRLTRMEHLDLSDNRLTGPIPAELGQLTKLKYLDLRDNQLSGPIPPELGQLTELAYLDLSFNGQLNGSIPPELSKMTGLERLYLIGNQLSGPIPPELSKLTKLVDLDLSRNRLSGNIPPELSELTMLQNLSLLDNELSGPVPTSLINLKFLSGIDVEANPHLCMAEDDKFQAWLRRVASFSGLALCSPARLPQTGSETSAIAPAAALILAGLALLVLGAGMRRVWA